MDNKRSVTIVIVNYNSSEYTIQCLDSIAASIQKHCLIDQVIVVDNNSKPDDCKRLRSRSDVQLILNKQNNGFAKACNQGAELSHSDYLLFLNPDTIVQPDTIERSILCYEVYKNDGIGVVGTQIQNMQGRISRTCSRFPKNIYYIAKCLGINRWIPKLNQFMEDWDHLESRKVDEVMGAYFLVSRDLFHKLQGFDERFFVYYEEVDFCYRLAQKGYYSYYDTDVFIIHDAGGASRNVKSSRLFYEWRSRILYMEKQHGLRKAKQTIRIVRFEKLSREVYLRIKNDRYGLLELTQAYDCWTKWLCGYREENTI